MLKETPAQIHRTQIPTSGPIATQIAVLDALAAATPSLLTNPSGSLPAALSFVQVGMHTRARPFGMHRVGSSFSQSQAPRVQLIGISAKIVDREVSDVRHAQLIGDPIEVSFQPSSAIACGEFAHSRAAGEFIDMIGFPIVLAVVVTPLIISAASSDPAPEPQIGLELLT